jgi:methylated-DNA-[protein]-cysteine S-methyltransferase
MKLNYLAMDLPTGIAVAAATPGGIVRLKLRVESLAGFLSELEAEFGVTPVEDGRPFKTLMKELTAYFSGEPVSFTVKLDVGGTPFQKKVWAELLKIPYGNVRSYKWLAAKAGKPDAARAVGGALHANRVPIIIPCHRVIESSGGLGGYGGGLDIKRWLLELEGVLP